MRDKKWSGDTIFQLTDTDESTSVFVKDLESPDKIFWLTGAAETVGPV